MGQELFSNSSSQEQQQMGPATCDTLAPAAASEIQANVSMLRFRWKI